MQFIPIAPTDETLGEGGTNGVAWVNDVRTTWSAEGLDPSGFRKKHEIAVSKDGFAHLLLDERVKLLNILLLEDFGGVLLVGTIPQKIETLIKLSCLPAVQCKLAHSKEQISTQNAAYCSFYEFRYKSLLAEPAIDWQNSKFAILESSRYYMRDPELCPPFVKNDVSFKSVLDYHSTRKAIGRKALFPSKIVIDRASDVHIFDSGSSRCFISKELSEIIRSHKVTGLGFGARTLDLENR